MRKPAERRRDGYRNPVFVSMKWHQKTESAETWTDPDVAFLRRTYGPPTKPPARERTPIGLGMD
jgi:hypothetical protein